MGAFNTGKCPHCGDVLWKVEMDGVDITVNFQPKWRGVAYHCPKCKTVLGVQMDPVSLRADIVELVVAALRGKS